MPFNNRDGSPMRKPARPALPTDKVRFVGDPVACVVARDGAAGKDAAEAVVVDIEPLPAVTDPQEAVAPGAPQLYDDAPGNVALDYHYGDAAQVAAAFAQAAHVTRLELVNNRVVVNAMEPRAALAPTRTAASRSTSPRKGVFGMRGKIAQVLAWSPKGARPHRQCRRLVRHEGAGLAEYICALHAARALGRPVKWTDERSGSFVSDPHGRDHRSPPSSRWTPTEISSRCGSPASATWGHSWPRSGRCRPRSTP